MTQTDGLANRALEAASKGSQSTFAKGLQSMQMGFGKPSEPKYILEGVSLELESRSSEFVELHNKNYLDCAIIQA